MPQSCQPLNAQSVLPASPLPVTCTLPLPSVLPFVGLVTVGVDGITELIVKVVYPVLLTLPPLSVTVIANIYVPSAYHVMLLVHVPHPHTIPVPITTPPLVRENVVDASPVPVIVIFHVFDALPLVGLVNHGVPGAVLSTVNVTALLDALTLPPLSVTVPDIV